jgi:uncharacterized caspase-like protein
MRILIISLTAMLTMAGLGPTAAQQSGGRLPAPRVALVIGNAAYPNADRPLREPISDANALADELRQDGFDVEVGANLTKEGMRVAINGLYDKIKPGSGTVALLFFSGYGIQSASHQSFLIPIDAQIYKERDVAHDGISVDHVLSEMQDRGAAVKIVVLDASRRNRFENFRSPPMGLAVPANPPVGSLVLFSAAPGSITREATSDHSLFVTELIKQMRVPNVQGDDVFGQTVRGVSRASSGDQTPSAYSSLGTPFSFGPDFVTASAVTTPVVTTPVAPTPPPRTAPTPTPPAPPSPPTAERPREQAAPAPSPGDTRRDYERAE